MHMTAVDLWQSYPDKSDHFEWRDHEQFYNHFKDVVDQHFADRVTIKRMDTVEASKDFADESVDFVFVDADHTYEGCKRDIQAWWPKVKKGGLMAGHDYNVKWPGVVIAVDELFPRTSKFSDSVWAIIKPE